MSKPTSKRQRDGEEDDNQSRNKTNYGPPNVPFDQLILSGRPKPQSQAPKAPFAIRVPSLLTQGLAARGQSRAIPIPIPQGQSLQGRVIPLQPWDVPMPTVEEDDEKQLASLIKTYAPHNTAHRRRSDANEDGSLHPENIVDSIIEYTTARDIQQMTPINAKVILKSIEHQLSHESSPAVWTQVLKLYCKDNSSLSKPDKDFRLTMDKEFTLTISRAFCKQNVHKELHDNEEFLALMNDEVLAPHIAFLLFCALSLRLDTLEAEFGSRDAV
ncbi:MAG: hypothetical protein Q9168_004403 [Polycauliona sp. 1 TL-2023]